MDIYFSKFPLIYYVVDINGVPTTKVVRDITINVRVRKKILENADYFDEYVMDSDETPEIVAHKYYGSVLYQWVVMLCNQRYNLVEDFPMDYHTFNAYLAEKYRDVEVPTFPSADEQNLYFRMTGDSDTAVDTSLKWALFPTEHGAAEYIAAVYNTYGRDIHASTKLHSFHHYEDLDGNIINNINPEPASYPPPINAVTGKFYLLNEYKTITNFEYEERTNEQKRHLYLISKETLSQIIDQLKEALS